MSYMKKAALAAIVVTGFATQALAQDFALKFQSSDPAGNPNYILEQEWAARVSAASGGRLAIEVLPVGSIVEYNETQDAVAAGILDGHLTDPSYFTGKDPAFGLIANPVGAWSDPTEMLRFMKYGGGTEVMRDLQDDYGLYFIGASSAGLEAFVSKVPLDGVDDLKGLKLRAPEGLVQEVFAAAGAAPVNLPGSEVFTSLDKGVIDAADYTVFSTNQAQGLHDVAKHPVYPGFHSLPMIEVSMNLEKWNSLPDDLKALMEMAVDDLAYSMVNSLILRDQAAVSEARANPEITVHDWSQEERAKFRSIAVAQWAKVAERSENAKKVYDTLAAYLEKQGLLAE